MQQIISTFTSAKFFTNSYSNGNLFLLFIGFCQDCASNEIEKIGVYFTVSRQVDIPPPSPHVYPS